MEFYHSSTAIIIKLMHLNHNDSFFIIHLDTILPILMDECSLNNFVFINQSYKVSHQDLI